MQTSPTTYRPTDEIDGRDAMTVLGDAIERCQDKDILEEPAVLDALAYLDEHAGHVRGVLELNMALEELHPVARRKAARQAHQTILRAVSYGAEGEA